eukprot:3235024-Prymnesium_polylepis.1
MLIALSLTKVQALRSPDVVRRRPCRAAYDGSLAVTGARALAQCARERGYILGSAISRERLR